VFDEMCVEAIFVSVQMVDMVTDDLKKKHPDDAISLDYW
jgi:hypothetical protein